MLIHDADALMAGLVERLRDVRGVRRIEVAGSLRRRRPTIGDLDLLAAVDDPAAVIAALDGLREVDKVVAAGTDKSSILLADGPRVDLMVCAPEAWGTHLVHFTGSKDHNIALRGMALDRGWSLSEKGWKVIETGELLLDAEEADVYERLRDAYNVRCASLRDRLWDGIRDSFPEADLNGPADPSRRLANNLNLALPGLQGETVLLALDMEGIAASAGSACTTGNSEPSHVLRAMGLTDDRCRASLRFSVGRDNTAAEIDETVAALTDVVARVRSLADVA